jgi:hypothetical protein
MMNTVQQEFLAAVASVYPFLSEFDAFSDAIYYCIELADDVGDHVYELKIAGGMFRCESAYSSWNGQRLD